MQLADNRPRFAWFVHLAAFVLVVGILRFGQEVLLPIAFAALLAFLLSPLVVRLVRWGLPNALAIVLTVVVAFTLIGAAGWIVTTQAIGLARELPNYEQNIQNKIAALKKPQAPVFMSRMAGMIEHLRQEIQSPDPTKAGQEVPSSPEPKPVPVEVHQIESTPLDLAREIVGPILRPLGTVVIVIVFVVAILFQREDLRDRFIKLVSAGQLSIATTAIDDAAQRVSRYLGMQLVVNACYGVPIGIGLHFIGIPNALLWGVLAILLKFIPFVGPWIAASFPVALAVAVDPGWSMLGYTLALFIVVELVCTNIVEIKLYGAGTGISNLALLVAAVFWTWLWGPAGLVLSTPFTVCLLVIGTYVPGMRILGMLLGSEPVLEPPAQFYQRMLSMESEDMLELASKFIAEHSLEKFYDDVFVPALLMSERDRHSGALAVERQQFIFQSSRELIDELERHDESTRTGNTNAPTGPANHRAMPATPVVLGVPARDDADEIVAQMLAHLLRRRGISVAVTALATRREDIAATIEQHRVKVVFISALPPSAVVGARQLWHRLNARCSTVPLVVGVWGHDAALNDLANRLHVTRPNDVVTTLVLALDHIELALGSVDSAIPFSPALPIVDQQPA